jgi:hypothetical protein
MMLAESVHVDESVNRSQIRVVRLRFGGDP